jgi:hypothetical protein
MRQDIEASVIGGLLIGGLTPTASDVLATLEPEAFSIPLYRKAFEVIRKQARNRNLIDALMVAEACGEEHFTSILMTSKNCPSAANLKGYAGMVADNYHRRLVLEIMDEMREPIQSGTIDASSQAMDELVKRLSAIRKPRDEVKPVRLGEIITDYTDTLDRRLRNGEESDTLKTGIEELDAITGGMNAEDLVIIAARPGIGKTELALKIAEGVASRVIPGFYVRFFWDWLAFISGAFRWKVFAVFADDVGETSSLSSHAALSPHRAFHSRASRASSDHLTPCSVPNACISSNSSANSLTRILLVDWPITTKPFPARLGTTSCCFNAAVNTHFQLSASSQRPCHST